MKDPGNERQPGTPARFVLVPEVTPDTVLEQVSTYGGKVLRASLTTDAEARLNAALAQGQAAATPERTLVHTAPGHSLFVGWSRGGCRLPCGNPRSRYTGFGPSLMDPGDRVGTARVAKAIPTRFSRRP